MKFWPRPPNSCFAKMMANALPTIATQTGADAGRFIASNRPVTTADRSLIVTGFFVIFSYSHSKKTAEMIAATIRISALRPK